MATRAKAKPTPTTPAPQDPPATGTAGGAPEAVYLPAVPVDAIEVRPQVRKAFDEGALAELAESIKAHGLLEPLLLRMDPRPAAMDASLLRMDPVAYAAVERSGLVLVAGERRLRAAKTAGLAEVPAIVRDMDEATAAKAQLLENLQRADLDPVEEAQAYAQLVDVHGVRVTDLARELGVSDSHISNRRRLLRLPEAVLQQISHEKLPHSVALSLVNLDAPAALVEAAAQQLVTREATQAEAPDVIARSLLDACPIVGPANSYHLKTCDASAHLKCPCRRKLKPRYGMEQAVCVDAVRFAEVEAEARKRVRAKIGRATAAATSGGEAIDVQTLGWHEYGATAQYKCVDSSCAGEHAACACLRDAVRYGQRCKICVDPKAFATLEGRAKRAATKVYKTDLEAAQAEVSEWAAARAEATFAAPLLGLVELAYLAANILCGVEADFTGPSQSRRASVHDYLARFGVKGVSSGIYDRAGVADYLVKHVDPRVMWRMIFEWPLLAMAPENKASIGWWYRRRIDGTAQPSDPLPEVAGTKPCALCDHPGEARLTLLWINESDHGAPIGATIETCPDGDCNPEDFDLEPDGTEKSVGVALEQLGWAATYEEPPEPRPLADEDALYRLRRRVRAELTGERYCRWCGCTEDDPCYSSVTGDSGDDEPCSWVEEDLCSACVGKEAVDCA